MRHLALLLATFLPIAAPSRAAAPTPAPATPPAASMATPAAVAPSPTAAPATTPAAEPKGPPPVAHRALGPALVLEIDDVITAVTTDFIRRSIDDAVKLGSPVVVLRLDTPGGRLDATRDITQVILGSPIPVIGYVSPPGARAASAGFLILMACDVAAMAPGTNTGAASVVGGQGEDLPQTISKKITEDTTALVRSIVGPRGRPVEPAVKTVTDAIAYSETEAMEKKLVEIVAKDLTDLFKQLDGRTIRRVGKPDAAVLTAGVRHEVRTMTALQRALGVIANPALAGILFLIGLAGLYAEMQNPGASFPGIIGGICLILALFAMSVLPTSYAGIALILVGLLFFFLEVKLTAHGFFAIGGAIAMILGAALLFHENDLAPKGEFWAVVAGAVVTAGILLALSFKALSIQGLPDRTGAGSLVGVVVPASTGIGPHSGKVFVDGAIWEARSDAPVDPGQEVEVTAVDGLVVRVKAHGKPAPPSPRA